MSHAIYQTPALILKTKNTHESNKLVYLYTQKFGLVYASMQSLRELRSKMRYHIHPYSLVDVDLVSGKNIWRITGVHENRSSFELVDSPWYRLVSLVSDMITRLCIGEEVNEHLWNDLALFFDNLKKENEDYLDAYEIIIIVRILDSLGYWDTRGIILESKNPYNHRVFEYINFHYNHYIQKINEALHSSQL